jgi:hypothetical protein
MEEGKMRQIIIHNLCNRIQAYADLINGMGCKRFHRKTPAIRNINEWSPERD